MKIFKLFFTLLFLVICGVVIYLGYLGFIPVLSNLMGVNKTKDLGIKYTKQNYESYIQKGKTEINYVKNNSAPASSVKLSGTTDLKESFSQEDISARLNYSNWKYMPVTNTQLRVNSDGSVEFSANIIMTRLPEFITYTGLGKYSMEDLNKGLKYLDLLKVNPPVYLKFTGGAVDNKINLNVQTIQVGKFSVPLDKFDVNGTLAQITENVFSKAVGFYAKSVSFSDGQMKFEGTVPEKMEVESN